MYLVMKMVPESPYSQPLGSQPLDNLLEGPLEGP